MTDREQRQQEQNDKCKTPSCPYRVRSDDPSLYCSPTCRDRDRQARFSDRPAGLHGMMTNGEYDDARRQDDEQAGRGRRARMEGESVHRYVDAIVADERARIVSIIRRELQMTGDCSGEGCRMCEVEERIIDRLAEGEEQT